MKSIVEMSKLVLRNLAARYGNVKEGVDAVMGGRALKLMSKLILTGRTADAEKAANDPVYREKLYSELGIS